DSVELPNSGKYDDAELTVLQFEFKHDLDAYLAALPATVNAPHSLRDLIAFDEREREREMAWLDQDLLEKSQARGTTDDKVDHKALKQAKFMAGAQGIDAALRKHHLDALIAPSAAPAWTTDLVNGDHVVGGGATQAPAVAGYPHVTVPAGFVHG